MPKGILISRDDNSKKYSVTFELPAYICTADTLYAERLRLSSLVRVWTGFFTGADGVLYSEAGKNSGR